MNAATLDYQLIFQSSPEVLLVLLPDAPRYTIATATSNYLRVTGTTSEQLIGKGLFDAFPDNPQDPTADGVKNLRASLDRVLATRGPDTMAVQRYDIRRSDGSYEPKYWSPKNVPIVGGDGAVTYILHRVEDVTELVNASEVDKELRSRNTEMEREVILRSRELAAANEELREANLELGKLDSAKTIFFSNISHEFRTPLTLMLGPIEDALRDAEHSLSAPQRTRIQLAHDNALRLLHLVNALLDFSRIEAGRVTAHYAPMDIASFTAQLAGMFHSAAEKAHIQLKIDCSPLSTPIWLDRDMWEKIVPNLVSNALKFTLQGCIDISIREHSDHVVLTVADTGVGIPPQELPKIFDRFHRVADAGGRTHEGTGIGLALVHDLVELHGGSVSVDSTLQQGSVFRVIIPKGYAHLPQHAVSMQPLNPRFSREVTAQTIEAVHWNSTDALSDTVRTAALKMSGTRSHVLIVDDNADLRQYLTGLLSPIYEVSIAANGIEAVELLQSRMADLVISDVMMPKLDGFGLVKKLRADPNSASTPIILLSARAGEESALDGLEAGADDYLIKPFSARELLARVRTHIQLAHMRRAWIAELERTNRELDAFSYSVSHDLRAPLRAIQGFADALLEDYGDRLDVIGRSYVGDINKGAARMTILIETLLNLARITRTTIKNDYVDLTALADAIVNDLRLAAPQRIIKIEIESNLHAYGDRELLNVMLVNLLSNAWKFTAQVTDARIEVKQLNAEVPTFYVRDNGAGFDMANASHLFTAFHRLHDRHEFEGTGVGLATVQRIVNRHGGRIWAESTINEGASFFFTLPG